MTRTRPEALRVNTSGAAVVCLLTADIAQSPLTAGPHKQLLGSEAVRNSHLLEQRRRTESAGGQLIAVDGPIDQIHQAAAQNTFAILAAGVDAHRTANFDNAGRLVDVPMQ